MAKKNEKDQDMTAEITITKHPEGTLFFREAWADGKHDGKPFEVTRNASASAIHFHYQKHFYTVTLDTLVQAFLGVATKT